MKKWAVASLLACYLFLFNAGVSFSGEIPAFRDIKGSFAEKSIDHLARQGIIHGINAQQFGPGRNVTRLQFAILIAKSLGVQPFYPAKPTFSDIRPGTAEAGYVEALANLGLISGTKNKIFNGGSPVTRQDAAVILSKSVEANTQVSSVKITYIDASRISPYAADSVAYVTSKKWMNGSRGYFYPTRYLTRAEAAILIDRLFETGKERALTALQQPVTEVGLGLGETQGIETNTQNHPVTFTTVYGMDSLDVFSVSSSSGLMVSGKRPGKGTMTVNAGSKSYPVAVTVYNPETGEGPSADSGDPILWAERTVQPANYKVLEHSPDAGFKNTEYKTYSGPVDGIFSKSDTWTGFFRQQGRDIIVDLGVNKTISGISLEFKQDANSGVYLPKYIKGSLSVDGTAWYQLGNVYHGVDPADKKVQNVTFSLNLPPVTTRYIKISFPVDVFVFARHMTIKGGSSAERPVILAAVPNTSDSAGTYMRDPDIKDVLLVFTGDKSEQQSLTSADFTPLAAYVDRQGQIKGRMFDTMLFLPANGLPCTSESWNSYLEDLFTPGKQLYALEEAMGKINSTTGMYLKENVILALPYPDSKQMEFGIIGVDGKNLSFSEMNVDREQAARNRFEAVQWYYSSLMDRWNSAGFKNLNLSGIYWYGELISPTVYEEAQLVQKVSGMVRIGGRKFIWIPYYGAPGFENWKSFGFTHVFLQPNYYANQAPPEDRMDRAAELARRNTTGIELELDNRMLTSRYYYDLFYSELNKAHQQGLDRDTPSAYYTGLKRTLLEAVTSSVPQIRGIYDDIYKWINGSYSG
ncbi:MAG TPA: DUF4855 domain-containing protein [Desulfobacteria bacterium]|nr:DUF4855 domain-containing protein [Desulfobacteria bacterium]